MDRHVLITGASSGIGRALALACARPRTTLHLGGRDPARLAETAAACRQRGAEVSTAANDVRDAEAMARWIETAGRLDLVIANAGIAGASQGELEPPEQTRAIFATNIDGTLNTVLPALAVMARQPPGADGMRGRIAVIASIAALVATPAAPAYCAAKAAIDRWTVANAPLARARGIALTSVCPGYIATPMTAGIRSPMPGLMTAEQAAAAILRGIAAGRVRVAFPWWIAFGASAAGLLPARLAGALLARRPGKDPPGSQNRSEGGQP